jgi:hypothetical protein
MDTMKRKIDECDDGHIIIRGHLLDDVSDASEISKLFNENKSINKISLLYNINSLDFIKDLHHITYLDLTNAGITDDIAKITNNKSISSIRFGGYLHGEQVEAIVACKTITHIELSPLSNGIKSFIKLLIQNDTLRYLDVSRCNINNIMINSLILTTSLKSLIANNNDIDDDGLYNLCNNVNLTELSLNGCEIKDKGLAFILKNPRIKKLHLQGSKFTLDGIKALANSSVEYLDLSNSYIIKIHLETFAKSSSITHLILASNRFTNNIVKPISESKSITHLDISSNKIDWQAMEWFMNITTLTSLNVAFNHIEDKGAIYLSKNQSLLQLNASYAGIKDDGAIHLSKNRSITELNLQHNSITSTGINELIVNKNLIYLNINSNITGHIHDIIYEKDMKKIFMQNRNGLRNKLMLKEKEEVLLFLSNDLNNLVYEYAKPNYRIDAYNIL